MNTNKQRKAWFFPTLGILICLGIFAVLIVTFGVPKQYVTTDLEDYGKYIGNYDNKSVQEFITSFFPQEIKDDFSNVTYSYRAQKNDAYAFEAYLSFTVENKEVYDSLVEEHTTGMRQGSFRYDCRFHEYILIDEFLPDPETDTEGGINIRYAKIGKILCCPESREIIFVALGVYDGGIAETDFLTVYFDRFRIDPLEYAVHTVPRT